MMEVWTQTSACGCSRPENGSPGRPPVPERQWPDPHHTLLDPPLSPATEVMMFHRSCFSSSPSLSLTPVLPASASVADSRPKSPAQGHLEEEEEEAGVPYHSEHPEEGAFPDSSLPVLQEDTWSRQERSPRFPRTSKPVHPQGQGVPLPGFPPSCVAKDDASPWWSAAAPPHLLQPWRGSDPAGTALLLPPSSPQALAHRLLVGCRSLTEIGHSLALSRGAGGRRGGLGQVLQTLCTSSSSYDRGWGAENQYLGRHCHACSHRLWLKDSQLKSYAPNTTKPKEGLFVMDTKKLKTGDSEDRTMIPMSKVSGPGKALPRLAVLQKILINPNDVQTAEGTAMKPSCFYVGSPYPQHRYFTRDKRSIVTLDVGEAEVDSYKRLHDLEQEQPWKAAPSRERPTELHPHTPPLRDRAHSRAVATTTATTAAAAAVAAVAAARGPERKGDAGRVSIVRPVMQRHVEKGRELMVSRQEQESILQESKGLLASILDYEIPGIKGVQTYTGLLDAPDDNTL